MGTRDLPDMYAQSLRAAGLRAEGILKHNVLITLQVIATIDCGIQVLTHFTSKLRSNKFH